MKTNIQAFVFDLYGTLFDVHSVIETCDQFYPGQGSEISTIWRQKQIEYSFWRQLAGWYRPFHDVTRDALRYAIKANGLNVGQKEEDALMKAYERLTPFSEVESVLRTIKERQKQVVIFSNGSEKMLYPLLQQSPINEWIDEVLSVDIQKVYKPHPASYSIILDQLGVNREDIVFISSNGWDISGAAGFGFHTAWINRTNMPLEELQLPPDKVYKDLQGLIEWL